jgi:hypothetical protein
LAKASVAESQLSLEEAIYNVSIIDCGNPRDPSSGTRRRRRHPNSLQNSSTGGSPGKARQQAAIVFDPDVHQRLYRAAP